MCRSDKQSVKAMISMCECEREGGKVNGMQKKESAVGRTGEPTEGFNANVVTIKINSLLHTCIRYATRIDYNFNNNGFRVRVHSVDQHETHCDKKKKGFPI